PARAPARAAGHAALGLARHAPRPARSARRMTPVLALHLSLVACGLVTAIASAVEAHGQGAQLLLDAGIADPRWQAALIWAGVAADTAVGAALWRRPGRVSCAAALVLMALMTA